ncbi:MAG TPA: PVC-type heme-binding CxxCH protein [Candidatus Binatia bacterium]|nr:PVC-type heme-binding CxxCH protein [Candidatus Binatia bacterium]
MFTAKCRLRALLVLLLGAILPVRAADPFSEYVRSTDPLTPEAELKTFHLPDGFEIQLFAAEPQISKPMNMAFDERGRLWITQSREYPFPVPLDKKGRDEIKILEDTDGDGRADRITTFVDELNIPIGIYPYRGGVIAWSIPNIWYFQDTDGDGKADKREVLFGPLGWEKDTHGMNSSFRRGYDGWIYLTHGFNNTSVVKGRDGSEITLNSGNTYRIRPDGSRVEPNTWGQVNPFGLTFDPLGNLYSADCHSSPIYQLLRGGHYPSFGKPDDGLGFAPTLMQHSHNSTAIGGIMYYADDQWPAEFRDNIFVGNVMTSRVNRDSTRFTGSSPTAKELPDFLTTDDSWFRPVDLQLGPDGALYVADFYNRIIGHYEVPLTHPGRDRERGRIWRITYRAPGVRKTERRLNLVGLTPDQVIGELASPNLTRRMLAMNHLTDNIGRAALEPARRALATSRDANTKVHSLWVLHRLGGLDARTLAEAASDRELRVRTHVMRVLSETPNWTDEHRKTALAGLRDADANVQRAAADALGQHPAPEQVRPLLDLRQRVAKSDNHLLYTVRMAVRNQLKSEGAFAALPKEIPETDSRAIADVAIAVPSQDAGAFLSRHVEQFTEPAETLGKYLRHIAKYLPADGVDRLVQLARRQFADDIDTQLTMFKAVQEGVAQRGAALSAPAKMWGEEIAIALLKAPADSAMTWRNTPIEGMKETKNPWFVQKRQCADGKSDRFLSSLPSGGEHLTGVLRSTIFAIPPRITFYLAGHDGPPDKGPKGKNMVRLRVEDGDAVLVQAAPPRNDTAQKVTWDLSAHAGKQGHIEVVDGDTGSAYAWLAIGRFDPPVVGIPKVDPSELAKRQQAGADLARTLQIKRLQPDLTRLLTNSDAETEAAAGRAIASFSGNDELVALVSVLAEQSATTAVRERILGVLAQPPDAAQIHEAATETMRVAPHRMQIKLAQALASSSKGSETLLQVVKDRIAPAALLQERAVREKLVASSPALAAQIDELTRGLTPPNEAIQKLIDQRRRSFSGSKPRLTEGAQLFAKNCAVCHQLEGLGGLVGPQLDGIGNRGLERLCEDLLDPNRSVDHAFRTTLLVLKDGDIVSGLLRREEGATIVLADSTGKEINVDQKQVTARRQSDTSLMPENFGELLSAQEFTDLMGFLLSKSSQGTKTAANKK